MPPISVLDHYVAVQPFHIDPGGPVENPVLNASEALFKGLAAGALNPGLQGHNPQVGRGYATPGAAVSLNPQPLPPVASEALNLWEHTAVLRGANLPSLF